MANYKVEEIKNNGYLVGIKFQIPLTKDSISEFIWHSGEGYFSVGVKGIDRDNIKVWVDKEDIINWKALDECNIIDWPRFLYYTGNDTSFITWTETRDTESFTWKPLKEMKVDFSKSMIYSLAIQSDYEMKLTLGNKIKYLDLYGDPNNFVIEKCSMVPSLRFYPKSESSLDMYKLPIYHCFKEAKELLVEVDPNGIPFDCSSLLQFPNLELLYLVGNMTNLDALKELKFLKKLGFWEVPDLTNVPHLSSWSNLNNFVAMNIDENSGKRLKKELAELKKIKKFEFASITKLRNKLWFETECGIPFSDWSEENEKKASKEYKICLKKAKNAKSEDDIKKAIIEFIDKINHLENIETVEREDIYNALSIIIKNSPLEIEHNKWLKWFDEARNF